MAVVILQGPSGAGKTTLGMRLAKDTDTPYFSKDAVKEMLFDTVGFPIGRQENHAYGRVAVGALFNLIGEFISLGKPLIVDCALYNEEAAADLLRYGIDTNQLLQLYLNAQPQVLMERFNTRLRVGGRHVGHGDTEKDDPRVFAEYAEKYKPLQIKNTIHIDTTEFDDGRYAALRRQVAEFLSSGT